MQRHLAGMHANSPPCSVHAFDIDKLRQPGVTFWSGWVGDEIVCMGALKRLDAENGEIKSMRVADAFLGTGAGRAMLEHILAEARSAGLKHALAGNRLDADAFDAGDQALRKRRLPVLRPVRGLQGSTRSACS